MPIREAKYVGPPIFTAALTNSGAGKRATSGRLPNGRYIIQAADTNVGTAATGVVLVRQGNAQVGITDTEIGVIIFPGATINGVVVDSDENAYFAFANVGGSATTAVSISRTDAV